MGAVTAGGASVWRACCSLTGPGGHRGAEGSGEQAPVEVEEVTGQQKAPASKLPWRPHISRLSRPATSRPCSPVSSSPCRSNRSLSFVDGWWKGLARGPAVGDFSASLDIRVPCPTLVRWVTKRKRNICIIQHLNFYSCYVHYLLYCA
jgi:hypothetical protein